MLFRGPRRQLTVAFVILSGLWYFVLFVFVLFFFHANLTHELDKQLDAAIAEIVPEISLFNGQAHIEYSHEKFTAQQSKLLVTLQVFDHKGRMLEYEGPSGTPQLIFDKQEVRSGERNMRTKYTKLMRGDQVMGYLQAQLSTEDRDLALTQLVWIGLLVAPVLLIALGVSGYFFAERAARPIEEAFLTMKDFLADAGHELKTPLSIARSAIENSLAESAPGKVHQRLETTHRSILRMSALVDDLTLLAKLEGQYQAKKAPVQLASVVRNVFQEFSQKLEEKNIDVSLDLDENATVLGDADALARVVANLVSNGLQYSGDGSRIDASVKSGGAGTVLVVKDNGIGIPKSEIPNVTKRFYRVDKARDRASGGTGLGLAIVQAIADQHDAKLTIQSEEGAGTTISVTFPP